MSSNENTVSRESSSQTVSGVEAVSDVVDIGYSSSVLPMVMNAVAAEEIVRRDLEEVERKLQNFDKEIMQLEQQNQNFYTDLSDVIDSSSPEWDAEKKQQLASRVQRYVCSGKNAALSATDAGEIASKLSVLMNELRKRKVGEAAEAAKAIVQLKGQVRQLSDEKLNLESLVRQIESDKSNLENQIEQITARMDMEKRKNNEAFTSFTSKKELELKDLMGKFETSESNVKKVDKINVVLNKDNHDLKKQVSTLNTELKQKDTELARIHEELTVAKQHIQRLTELKETHQLQIERAANEHALAKLKMTQDLENAKREQHHEFSKEKQRLTEQVEKLKLELTSCNQRLVSEHENVQSAYSTKLIDAEKKIASLQTQLSDMKLASQKTITDLQLHYSAADAKDKELEKMKLLMESASESEKDKQIAVLREKLTSLEHQQKEAEKKSVYLNSASSSNVERLQQEVAFKDKELAILRDQLQNLKSTDQQSILSEKLAAKELELLKLQEHKETVHTSDALATRDREIDELKASLASITTEKDKSIADLKDKLHTAEEKINSLRSAITQIKYFLERKNGLHSSTTNTNAAGAT